MLFTVAASPVLNDLGVSFKVISLGFGIFYSILALSEIPTGAWADVFGAKKSSYIGGLVQTLALTVFSLGPVQSWSILLGFFLYGLGTSFVSGALSSLLYSVTKNEEGVQFNSNRYFSITEKVAVVSYVLASASVGFLSHWIGKGSFLVAAVFFLTGAVFVSTQIEEELIEKKEGCKKKEFFLRIREGFAGIRASFNLKILLPVRLLHQIETILGVLWLPWIAQLGGGDYWFSILATGSYLFRYAVNHYISKKDRPTSYMPRVAFSLALMALGSGICVFAHNVWMALFGVWIMASARGAFLPAVQAIMHEEFSEQVRTTGLSVMNFSTEVMIAVSYFISSSIVDRLDVKEAWQISAYCFGLAFFIVFVSIKLTKRIVSRSN